MVLLPEGFETQSSKDHWSNQIQALMKGLDVVPKAVHGSLLELAANEQQLGPLTLN